MINFTFETISPVLAKRLIEEHDEAVIAGEIINRRRNQGSVRRIAADILADQWFPETGETIKFEKNGAGYHGRHLVDGQTRLAAVEQSGRSIGVWVATGVARGAFAYIDAGDKRSLKNVLQIAGEADATILSSALTWLSRWDTEKNTVATGRAQLSHATATKLLTADPAIRKSVQKVRAVTLLGRGMAAFLHRVFSSKDPDLASRFIDAIATGENLRSDDPFYVLRERLIANKASRTKMRPIDQVAIAIRTWNAAREGRSVKTLKGRVAGTEMPVLV